MFDFKEGLKNNSDALIGLGAGLLGGRTGQEQLSGALTGFAQGRKTNSTMKWLEGQSPELAEAMRSGAIDGKTAVDLFWQKKLQSEKPAGFMNVGGVLVNDRDGSMVADYRQPKTDNTAHYRTIGPDEAAQYGAPPGHYQVNEQTNELKPLKWDNPNAPAPLTSTDKKALWAAEDEIPAYDSAISSLQRAKELNRKTFTGNTASVRGWLGSKVPGGDYVVDKDAAKATVEFNNLMSEQAIANMSSLLKGATTDQELNHFIEILADPATDPDIRERTIDRMMALAEHQKRVKMQRIQSIGGAQGGQSQSGGGASAPSTGISWRVK